MIESSRNRIQQVGRFGPPSMPSTQLTPSTQDALSPRDTRELCWMAVPAPPFSTTSPEVIALGALVLVVSRYNSGEPLLIASPSTDVAAGMMFPFPACDEADTVAAFLADLHAAFDETRRRLPFPFDGLAQEPAPNGESGPAPLRLGYTCGGPVPPAVANQVADVLLHVEPRAHEWRLEVSVRITPALVGRARRLTVHLARAIAWLAAHDDATLGDFELLSADERREVALDFNDTHVEVREGLTLHGLVAARAALTPDAVAIIYRETTVSYRSLEERANQLATLLRRDFAVPPGARVGVMVDRSSDAVVALYGVMKAGAAYVPIDPRHPWDTIRYMTENAGISVLIVDSETIAAAASFNGRLFVIDLELRDLPAGTDPAVPVAGTDLAYVIYTSGSTGRPKGVAIEHRAIVNTILWRNHFYGIGAADVNLQIPSFAFDSSVVDIFCVLTAGGTLALPDDELRLDARRLIAWSRAHRITSCIVTPSYYSLLVGELAETVPSLQWVTLAGESATARLVAAHLERLPGVKLFNEYGPTENAVCSTAARLDGMEPTVSIGRPIWNVAVFILDAWQRLCPIGAPGEIYLGGAGLARGYFNQDPLTDERFVPSPIPEFHQGRLYRTGDRASWRADGAIEFLGRLDRQVKVRGFRIELDAVELALCRYSGLVNAVVICKADANGANYLAAYVEAADGIAATDVREHMRREVPLYMVPDVIALLPCLPLTLNGKIDHAALNVVDDFTSGAGAGQRAASPVEESLRVLWVEVLQRRHIALDDNFFSIGGNSLRVMELTARIRAELSLDVGLPDIYTFPTIAELAGRLSEMNEERPDETRHRAVRRAGV
jgi:bacitracin synthase 3